jgi:hypothetical protein
MDDINFNLLSHAEVPNVKQIGSKSSIAAAGGASPSKNKKDTKPAALQKQARAASISSSEGSTVSPPQKLRKNPDAPKRFKSPYILFSISRMQVHKKRDDHTTNVTSLSRAIADEWKKLR